MKTNTNGKKKRLHAVTLKAVAEHVGLTPSTVSAVLNHSPASRSVPQQTQNRILDAARELNYRANFFARSLRVKRTFTIGVITYGIGDPYGGKIISGIERHLRQHGFFFLTVVHRHDAQLLGTYSHLLLQRGVEGFIAVGTSLVEPLPVPAVAVAGHRRVKKVTNLVLDHRTAARLALQHLAELGHSAIAVMKGPPTSSDSEDRWLAIAEGARQLGISQPSELTLQLKGDAVTPDLGYRFTKQLLRRGEKFTALFAFNDNCAIGAIRAIHEANLRVPEDISVVGFDDVESAAYSYPSLTTVRQPLEKMGEIAARTLLSRIGDSEPFVPEIAVEPELIIRDSTGPAPGKA